MTTVVMPQLGESVMEGTVVRWIAKPGQKVERDEPLVEIATDKANTEIPSPTTGVLVEQIANAVLYEGYLLYPYRPSAVKNRQRFNFGVLYPREYCELQFGSEASEMKTECLVAGKRSGSSSKGTIGTPNRASSVRYGRSTEKATTS